jgi:hypothetical protein
MPEFVKKIHSLPGAVRTPQVLLAQTEEKLPRIKALAMVIQWDDDTFSGDWSSMNVAELNLAVLQLQEEAKDVFFGTHPSVRPVKSPA